MITKNGSKFWYWDGKIHRTDGPAVIYDDGDMEWWVNGKIHRVEGPAIYDKMLKYQEWWQNDQLHRIDGPAIICETRETQWYVDGKFYGKNDLTTEQYLRYIRAVKRFIKKQWTRTIVGISYEL